MYMFMLGHYTFWVLPFGTKKSVSYISVHSADRMTWDENESYYLGDLHLMNIVFFQNNSKS